MLPITVSCMLPNPGRASFLAVPCISASHRKTPSPVNKGARFLTCVSEALIIRRSSARPQLTLSTAMLARPCTSFFSSCWNTTYAFSTLSMRLSSPVSIASSKRIMHELNACCPIVQVICAAGTRKWKKRNAVRRSCEDDRTKARPLSEALGEPGGEGQFSTAGMTGWVEGRCSCGLC